MPVYEYKCKACGREFEYQQRMSDPDKTDCEACGKPELERLISRTAFQLKGSGWYKDLYSSSKPEAKGADGAAKSEPAKTDSASSTSTDSGSSSSKSDSSAGGTGSGSSGSSGTSSSGSGSGSSGTSGGGSGSKAAASAS